MLPVTPQKTAQEKRRLEILMAPDMISARKIKEILRRDGGARRKGSSRTIGRKKATTGGGCGQRKQG